MNEYSVRYLIAANLFSILNEIDCEIKHSVRQFTLEENTNRIFDIDFLFGRIDFE
jgi:hypothetical protein